MSETTPSPESSLAERAAAVAPLNKKPAATILNMVGKSSGDEPIGFALLMSPYKAKLLDLEAVTASFLKRTEEITQGQSTSQSTEQFIEKLSKGLSAEDLKFQGTLYSTQEILEKDAPRIIFPLPIDIRDQLMVNYQTSDMASAGAFASFGSDLARNIKQGKGLDMGADSYNSALAAGLLSLAPTPVSVLAGQYLGAVVNPFTVTAFRNVEPRAFNFEFRITPESIEQSETLQECINTLRYCALPEPTSAGLTLAFPYRFKLAWLGALKMFDFSEAVLTQIQVNYSAGGSPAFFEYTAEPRVGGSSPGFHPVTVTIILEFKELFPLTKETIMPTGKSTSNYKGEMTPRLLNAFDIEDNLPPSSPETKGGATTTDPAENQTGAGDDALNTPDADDRAIVEQAQSGFNDSVNKMESSSRELKNEGEGGFDAFRAQQGLIPASEVYLAVNRHDAAVDSFNNARDVLQANPLSSKYVQDIPQASTWFQKVQAGTSGSRSGISVWQTQYDKGKADWNKTSGGGG
jgi:hypothetical protein